MTSDASRALAVAFGAVVLAAALPALAAESGYPFEGTWVRANRVCTANAPRVRTYTSHEVTFPTGHCSFRKVATGGGLFEIFEDCRRAERPGNYTETIRMLGPDLMQMRRSAARLKIARPLRYTRCSAAAPAAAAHAPASPAGPHRAPQPGAEPKLSEPRPPETKPEAKPPETKPPETKP